MLALCATTIHVKTTSKVKITAPQVRIVTASPREQELSKHMVARTGTEPRNLAGYVPDVRYDL